MRQQLATPVRSTGRPTSRSATSQDKSVVSSGSVLDDLGLGRAPAELHDRLGTSSPHVERAREYASQSFEPSAATAPGQADPRRPRLPPEDSAVRSVSFRRLAHARLSWPGCCSATPRPSSSTSPPTTSTSTPSGGQRTRRLAWAPSSSSATTDFIDGVANRVIEMSHGRPPSTSAVSRRFVVDGGQPRAARAAANRQAKQLAKTEQFIERFQGDKARGQSRVKALAKIERITVPDDGDDQGRFALPRPPVVRSYRAPRRRHRLHDEPPVLTGVDLRSSGACASASSGRRSGQTTLLKVLLVSWSR